ncbi:MAG TPA: hypothetical protein VK669_08870 [Candidatus Limnocylindrales bacterium]|nr:hypothetical protein [Candidatus Limnocylindrales bacterium]
MSELGDLFGGIGEFFGGLREARGEDAPAYLGERDEDDDDDGEGNDGKTAVDRYLTGAPRVLNVNDR